MKTRNVSFSYREYEEPGQLDKDDMALLMEAKEAALNAYAPYSGFNVGVSIRLASGAIVKGTNVENAASPAGICAERNALANCISNHPGDNPVAIAVAAIKQNEFTGDPVPPCGNCRQVIVEEELRNSKPIKMILSGKNKIQVIDSCSDLLPLQFNMNNL